MGRSGEQGGWVQMALIVYCSDTVTGVESWIAPEPLPVVATTVNVYVPGEVPGSVFPPPPPPLLPPPQAPRLRAKARVKMPRKIQ